MKVTKIFLFGAVSALCLDNGMCTRHPYPFRSIFRQAVRDHNVVQKRIANCSNYNEVFYRLRHLNKESLKMVAWRFAHAQKANGVPLPDRLCIRFRAAMICWFAAYYPNFLGADPCAENLAAGQVTGLAGQVTDPTEEDNGWLQGELFSRSDASDRDFELQYPE
jgi:hypothetical protein